MKVVFEDKTYLVHFETRLFHTQKGNNTERELTQTTCIIRYIGPDQKGGEPELLDSAVIRQCACDPSDGVLARKKAFIKATEKYGKGAKKALWAEYLKTTRITARTARQKNRQLKKQVKELTAKVAELELAMKKEEAII
jgi:hypothetical protein